MSLHNQSAFDSDADDSDLDRSYSADHDIESTSDSDVSYRSSESDRPNEACVDDGWSHVHPIDIPDGALQDQRHTDEIPFIRNEADIRPGPDGNPPDFVDPTDCFKKFVDTGVVQHIADSTNDRAREWQMQHPNQLVNGLKWKDVVRDTIYLFMGLCIVMGVNRLPRIADYWHHDPVFGGPPIFTGKVMSRNRFNNIMKFLRFARAEQVNKKDKKSQIESFLNLLREKCKQIVFPGLHIAIDESLIAWKGLLLFKQFIKTKRSRFGIKVFFLCPGAPDWQGYSYDFEVYYGKDTTTFHTPTGGEELSKSEQIVIALMQDLLFEGRHVVTDNWYTSSRLALFLQKQDTQLTGTINKARGIPSRLKDLNLQKKSSAFMRKEDLLACKYEDRKTVYSLSTRYPARLETKDRRPHGGTATEFKLPLQIQKYNEFMGSVDKADQLLKPYAFQRKSLAWFKKLGLHFIDRMVFNSYIVYKNAYPDY